VSTARELIFGTYNTRRNLPRSTGCRRGEANFLGSFLRSFMTDSPDRCFFGRHFAVPECGVADCIILRFGEAEEEPEKGLIMAFETKLSDWRKALSQAYRYRYYADVSIVVLPADIAGPAMDKRHLFQQSGVGLWTFNPKSGAICPKIATEKPKPLNPCKREQALIRIRQGGFQLRKVREEA